jgi:hypothetical protein
MTSHGLVHEEARRPRMRPLTRNGLVKLGWPHFWLLSAILGGMLGLVALVYLASYVSA